MIYKYLTETILTSFYYFSSLQVFKENIKELFDK